MSSNIYNFSRRMLGFATVVSYMMAFQAISLTDASAQSDSFKWIRNVHQQTVRDYSEGMSAFYENGLWGFVSTDGDVVIAPAYDEVKDFSNSLALVMKGDKWGVIDKSGNVVHSCEYDSISDFDSGVALAVKNHVMKSYLYSDGRCQELSTKYEFHPYSDGLARVRDVKKGKWGYINVKGVITINPKYSEATDFNNGIAIVSDGDKSFVINKAGDKRGLPMDYTTQMTVFDNGTGYIAKSDGSLAFFAKGFELTGKSYVEISDFSDGVARVKDNMGKISYINEKGENVLNLKSYADAGDFCEGMAWVRQGGKYGYVNKLGRLVIDTLFSYASDFNSNLAYVAKGQRQGVIKMASAADTYPMMDISDIKLLDANSNSTVEAEEKFSISFKVRNIGDEPLNDAVVAMGLSADQMDWFRYDNTKIEVGTLKPGEEKNIVLTGSSTTDIVSEQINITLKGEADNLYRFPSFPFAFNASGINACRPVLETFWVYTDDHSPLAPGQEATLKMTVRNTGTDMAKDVAVNLKWPEDVMCDDKVITIPSLAPGQTHEITTTFMVSAALPENAAKEFSVVALVDEYTHKRNEVKYISFETGKRNVLTNLVTGVASVQADYAPVVTKKVKESELLIDLDQRAPHAANRYALVIGNEDYNSMKQGATYQPDVEFAVRDAETFAKYATKVMGVKEDNVILVKNATYAQMKTSLEKVSKLAKANPKDLELIVYYAGHGQVDGDTKESYLIPVDVSITAPTAGLKLEDFYATLSACKAEKTMVFLDACYSGVGRGIVIRPKETPVKGNVVVMTATSSTQRSMPYQEKSHGLFTYFLLKAMKDGNAGMSIGDLYDEVSATVKTKSILINNAEQTPELISGPDIAPDWRNWNL